MHRLFALSGAVSGALAVILGALGAHALKKLLAPESLASFETGVKYQMYHALALLLLAALFERLGRTPATAAGWCFLVGTLLFSGSIYLLCLRPLFGVEGWRWLGPVTPLGGLALIAGWLCLALAAATSR